MADPHDSKAEETPSLKPERIRAEFDTTPNGDVGFTFKVVARRTCVEVNGDFIGPRDQGWASAAEHFGRRLAVLCAEDLSAARSEMPK
jgi:hypothetical protein